MLKVHDHLNIQNKSPAMIISKKNIKFKNSKTARFLVNFSLLTVSLQSSLPELKGIQSPSASLKKTIVGLSNVSTTANISLKHSPVAAESKLSATGGEKDLPQLRNQKTPAAARKYKGENFLTLGHARHSLGALVKQDRNAALPYTLSPKLGSSPSLP